MEEVWANPILSQISYLGQKNLTLDVINQFGHKLIKDLKRLRCLKETTTKLLTSVDYQTDNSEEEIESRRQSEHL